MPKSKIKIVTDACCKKLDGRGKGLSAGGVIILDEDGNVIAEKSKYFGEITTPQAEYSAVAFGLDCASAEGRQEVEVWTDSELVVRQMNGDYAIKSENIKPLFDEVKKLELRFLGTVKYFFHRRDTVLARQADKVADNEYRRHHN